MKKSKRFATPKLTLLDFDKIEAGKRRRKDIEDKRPQFKNNVMKSGLEYNRKKAKTVVIDAD